MSLSNDGQLGYFHTLGRLKTNKRMGWVNKDIKLPESIADHMYRMAMMALALPSESPVKLDISKCVMLCVVHDAAEADVGDITPPSVSGVSREDKLQMEYNAMKRILACVKPEPSERIEKLWNEYEDRETEESKVVKDLDLLELCVQAVEYEYAQDVKDLQEFFESTVSRIVHPTVKEWATELMQERKEIWEAKGWSDYKPVSVS